MTRRNNLHLLPERLDALLVANGAPVPAAVLRELSRRARQTIALDGGCSHCRRSRVVPDVVLGDFDSVPASDLLWARSKSANVLKLSSQDRSDVQKGLDYARAQGCRAVALAAVGGTRLDHTLAVLQAAEALRGFRLYLVSAETIALPMRGRTTLELAMSAGSTCSWFALSAADGCTMSGVRWPFRNRGLGPTRFGSLSNVVTDPPLCVSQRSGISWLLVQLAK